MFVSNPVDFDAVVIGGGFYGVQVVLHLKNARGLGRVALLEREPVLISRASLNNQARVHNGYHYPRSIVTAARSRVNFPKFLRDWPEAIDRKFIKLYAIPRRNSKISALQFTRFCNTIGARIKNARKEYRQMFDESLIEEVFEVEECAFNAMKLAQWATMALEASSVQVELNACVTSVSLIHTHGPLLVEYIDQKGGSVSIKCRYVFNCTYSALNSFVCKESRLHTKLKHEITEIAMVRPPEQLMHVGVTVMDGPFFSIMPHPAFALHSLSHVRYTPHYSWIDSPDRNPYEELDKYKKESRVDRMIRDAVRYLPCIAKSDYKHSVFEIKTVLEKNEGDDGRPILFEKHPGLPGCYSILGGKIDNIYDIIERLKDEPIQ
ncbi:MAG: FAD-binding oxidoreductase [Bdellovibrionaceae bacterium]|nr:FAD-binding oxidoreductase [Pseudobdellovibrionaceae bacterium]